ncbi:MAG: inositol monophosphatase [Candidatus Paceibacterota bacterium]|jgi:myo-inositol-1(or 4)-monophosphatase
MSKPLYTIELKIAKATALKVGRYLQISQKNNVIIKQPNGEGYLDVTTKIDLESERMCILMISRMFPKDHILSEETRNEYSSDWKRVWIIDPLDGTTNYVKRLDIYAVSIALVVNGKVVVAVNCLPVHDDIFHAVRGHGVFHNGKKLTCISPDDTLAQSLVSVGFPHVRTKEVADPAFELYKNLWLASSDLRRSASAVFDGCLLASGITGAYLTPDIKPWDIASGSLFVEEQGGFTSDFSGQPLDLFRKVNGRFSTSVLFAKNKTILTSLQRLTKKYNQGHL